MELHDPAAPDVTNEMTTLIATDAEVFIAGTTAAFCPQTVRPWLPPNGVPATTCRTRAATWRASSPRCRTRRRRRRRGLRRPDDEHLKVCGDPAYADDPAIQSRSSRSSQEYGSVTCADGSYSTGILYGQYLEDMLRTPPRCRVA